jgi:hypothetical protein
MKYYGPMDKDQRDFIKFVAGATSLRLKGLKNEPWRDRWEVFTTKLLMRSNVEQAVWYVRTFDFGRDKSKRRK